MMDNTISSENAAFRTYKLVPCCQKYSLISSMSPGMATLIVESPWTSSETRLIPKIHAFSKKILFSFKKALF